MYVRVGFHRLLRRFLGHTKDFKYFIILENRKRHDTTVDHPKPPDQGARLVCASYMYERLLVSIPKHPSATTGWNASVRKHKNYHFPSDAWVPNMVLLSDNPDGHVALRQPDGSIWSSSSPVATMPVHTSLEIYSLIMARLTYLSWTERYRRCSSDDLVTIAETDEAPEVRPRNEGRSIT